MSEGYIDLHTHSIKSDGSMTPAEVIRHAKEKGLKAVALSDHDSIEGVQEAMDEGKRIGIEVIPAIELSAQSETETHVLGYFIDIYNKDLLDKLEEVKRVRYQRNLTTAENLQKLGFDVTMEEALEIAPSGIVGRAHFARIMADKGYVKSVKEAFNLYLSQGKAGYCSTQALTDEESVELIHKAGGKAFVAHLHLTKKPDDELKQFLIRLKKVGLDGVEGYYTEYTPEMQEKYQNLAKELDLAICGGTDFHAAMKPHIEIGVGLGDMRIPYSVLENMKLL